jgi:hypothetical protein
MNSSKLLSLAPPIVLVLACGQSARPTRVATITLIVHNETPQGSAWVTWRRSSGRRLGAVSPAPQGDECVRFTVPIPDTVVVGAAYGPTSNPWGADGSLMSSVAGDVSMPFVPGRPYAVLDGKHVSDNWTVGVWADSLLGHPYLRVKLIRLSSALLVPGQWVSLKSWLRAAGATRTLPRSMGTVQPRLMQRFHSTLDHVTGLG